MSTPAARNYGGQSADARADQRRRQFLDATLQVSDSLGWRNVTVERLAKQAGVSKRYFYELFPDIDSAAAAAIDEIIAGLYDAVLPTIEPGIPFAEFAHRSIGALIGYVTDDPRRARLLFGELAAGEQTSAHRARAMRAIAETVADQARRIRHVPHAIDPIIETTATLLVAGTGQAVLRWLDGDLDVSRERLVDDLAALWVITGNGTAEHAQQRAATHRLKE